MSSDSRRSVKVLNNGKWTNMRFEDIKKGHVVRLYEPTGEIVKGFAGKVDFKALTDAYIDMEHDVYTFAMKEVE